MIVLQTLDRWLVKAEYAFLVLFFTAMMVLAFIQVILRNFFDTGLLWGDTLVRHLVIWVGFAGAAIATHEGRHISIDAFTKFLSSRWKAVVQIATNAFAIVVCYYLAVASLTFLTEEKNSGDMLVLSIPTWVGLIIIPSGYGLMVIHFLVRLIESGMSVFRNEPKTD